MRLAAALLLAMELVTMDVRAQCTGCFRPSFAPVIRSYAANAVDMVSTDFDGDGIPDLVIANASGIGFMRGSGTGSFAPPVLYASAGSNSIATADFNGDGLPDVATAGANLSIFLGNGDGSFQPPIVYTPDFRAYTFIAAADFNGDGIPDLAVTAFDPQWIRVYIGNGGGTFQPPIEFGGPFSQSLTVGDFNGDGLIDIAVSNFVPAEIDVFLNDGHGGFSAPLASPVNSYGSLAVGDFNQDGVPDLAVADFYNVVIMLGQGDGTFTVGESYAMGNGPNHVSTADFNHDGIADLAVSDAQDGNVLILPGHGDGTFGSAIVVPAGDNLGPLVARDFDGNWWLDVAVLSDGVGVEVLRADASGAFPKAQLFDTGGFSFLLALAELTGDGFLDTAVANPGGVAILPGLGNGQFQSPIAVPLAGGPRRLAAGRFNADSQMDLAVATDSGLQIILSNGDGTFQALAPFGTPSSWVVAADFNGDGKLDLAWIDSSGEAAVSLGNGDGTFSPAVTYPEAPGYAVAAADFNGDGKLDLAVSSIDQFSILLGNGDGTFTLGGTHMDWYRDLTRITAGDLDGDGKADVAVTLFGGFGLLVYWGKGDGTFETPATLPGGWAPIDVVVSDVNGDGRPDLLVSDETAVRIYAFHGDRTFDSSDWVKPIEGSDIAAGDLDEDGKLDLVTAGGISPGVAVLRNTICLPRSLAIGGEPASCDVPGVPFAVQPVLQVVDDGDNVIPCDASPVTAALLSGTGTPGASLLGTTTVSAVAGIATFTDLSIDVAGRGYVLEFTHPAGSTRSRTLTQGLGVVPIGPTALCSGTPASFRTGSGGYDRYQWTLDGSPISRADAVTLAGLAEGPHTLGVSVYEDGCTAASSLLLDVQATPATPEIVAPVSALIGQMGLIASVASHLRSSYQWTISGGTITGGQGGSQITFDAGPPGTTMILRVVETSSGGCSSPEGEASVQVDFADVAPTSPFRNDIDTLARHGISSGCGGGNYCPDSPVTRAQMAVFLLKAKHDPNFVPPPAGGIFSDVPPSSFAADWIEELHAEGITAGCGGGNYCPGAPVTRAQMAVLLLKTEHGSSYSPPPCIGIFQDVECTPTPAFAVDWVERLYNEGVTAGCGANPLVYCPGDFVTRGQMAVFLVKTFNLQ